MYKNTNVNIMGSFFRHIEKNKFFYLISFFCICTGIVIGFYSVKYLQVSDKNNIISWIANNVKYAESGNLFYKDIFYDSIKNYILVIMVIWLLGLTIIGTPLILIINIIKGYSFGFAFSFIISAYGGKGILASILSIFIQNIVFIPLIIISSVLAMECSINIFFTRGKFSLNTSSFVAKYSMKYLGVILIMFLGILIQTFLSSVTIKYMVGMI